MSGSSGSTPSSPGMCLVCRLSCRTHFHFGGASCTACASFFRRTVSLNIRYVCKRENDCISSPEVRSICRACRYDCCINKAGMNRDYYTTNSYTTLHEFSQGEQSESSPSPSVSSEGNEEFSKILDVSHGELLNYYVKQVELAKSANVKNTLLVNNIEELLEVINIQSEWALDACTMCPGVDILDRDDIVVLLKYFEFANIWIDSLWEYSTSLNKEEFDRKCDGNDPLSEFIQQAKNSLGSSLSHLNLNAHEFAALKSVCIWKLGVHDTTISIKIVAQEQYHAVTSALRKYYEISSNVNDSDVATKIAEITLQIVPVFTIYHDMVQFYENAGIRKLSSYEMT
ncbi:hypothetical protein L3Y34_007393 [Caenorhabditis briggsae]|uniref:Nuclear Hormone Receptor family n=1 Tax=Caenorhabditis briggsae TaxID=6238 RepID=A0AAE9CZM8_CAEBR|nr:hypothetical protein L3Y34_007393 [Caenorhabditis briggsae]